MQCMAPAGVPDPIVTWYHKNIKIIDRYRGRPGGPTITNEKIDHNIISRLTIPKLKLEDAGTYHCMAENIAGKRTSDKALLQIHAKPTITREVTCPIGKTGNQIKLKCVAEGEPLPRITWRYCSNSNHCSDIRKKDDRKKIDTKPERQNYRTQSTLTIDHSEASDSGRYFCKAENTVTNSKESEESSCTLQVYFNATLSIYRTKFVDQNLTKSYID